MTFGFVIQELIAGGRIEGRRAFPCPHRYHLVGSDGHRYGDALRLAWIVRLVEEGRLEVASHSPEYDEVDYQLRQGAPRLEVVR